MRMKQMVYMATVDGLVVFLDTNVIYPLIIRDILFWLAYHDVFVPKGVFMFLMNGGGL